MSKHSARLLRDGPIEAKTVQATFVAAGLGRIPVQPDRGAHRAPVTVDPAAPTDPLLYLPCPTGTRPQTMPLKKITVWSL